MSDDGGPGDTPAGEPPAQPATVDTDPGPSAPPPPAAADISPTPSGEDLKPEDTKKIMSCTHDILQICQKKVDEQKISSHSLSFMLLRTKETLQSYVTDYVPKLSNFSINAERITACIYGCMCCSLPNYGDLVKALEAQEGDKIDVNGLTMPVDKQELIDLVKNVVDNYHSAALMVKSGRGIQKDVYSAINDRKEMFNKVEKNMPEWLQLKDNISLGLDDIRYQAFKISAYLDFLKQGESKASPVLDLSPLAQVPSLDNEDKKDTKMDDNKEEKKNTVITPENEDDKKKEKEE